MYYLHLGDNLYIHNNSSYGLYTSILILFLFNSKVVKGLIFDTAGMVGTALRLPRKWSLDYSHTTVYNYSIQQCFHIPQH